MLFQVVFLIVAAATAIALGLWALTHMGESALGLLFLPTIISAAILSLGYLVGAGYVWLRSRGPISRRSSQPPWR